MINREHFDVYSTCPPSNRVDKDQYLQHVIDTARWSEKAGCKGTLVYTDNGLLDPWLVAQLIVAHTDRIEPLVAVQPAYMHPYSAAKMISTLSHLYDRRICINLVAGGFKNDLLALGDDTEHDQRYQRLVEYASIMTRLLSGKEPLTFDGVFYQVKNLRLKPPLDKDMMPVMTISGSSEAGLSAMRETGAIGIQYPLRSDDYEDGSVGQGARMGVRVGIIAREDSSEAWRVAHAHFPVERSGQIAHQLAMKVSDSEWHRQLSNASAGTADGDPYWLVPFENYKTFCPYLVGSYEAVAAELSGYLRVGYRTFILDVPSSPSELEHIGVAFDRAASGV
jgi:alkanesulfonate monooxygenase